MKKLLLLGAGGHAESCIDLLNEQNIFILRGICGKLKEKNKKILNKFSVNYTDKDLTKLSKKFKFALIGIGQIHSHQNRLRLFKKLKLLGFEIPTIKSKYSIISKHSNIGEGTVVMHGAIIGPNVKIGNNCIINSNVLIEHGSKIQDNVHVSTSATINSGVQVGAGSFIGSRSVIKQEIKIKNNTFIKMGSIIKKNL
jgi:sugar O-acyltransferase (sialic acid O-acetyltransferase NeuD family)